MSKQSEVIEAAIREIVREVVREELAAQRPNEPERTYSEAEFCKLVGISRDTAHRMRKAGRLNFYRPSSRRVRYTQAHIEDFLQERSMARKLG